MVLVVTAARARELDPFKLIWVKNLPSAYAKAGGGGAICVVPFLKAWS